MSALQKKCDVHIDRLQNDLAADVKKLKGFKNKYRLRAGNYRILFEVEDGAMVVYDVGDRKDICVRVSFSACAVCLDWSLFGHG